MAPTMWRAATGSGSAATMLEPMPRVSGSSSSRISLQTRIRSARAACMWRSQKASRAPSGGCSATATPWRAGSSPMMWRTMTSGPNWPRAWRCAGASASRCCGSVRPTRVRRSRSIACCGCASDTPSSRSSTSSAGSPSSSSTRLPSTAVIVRSRSIGCAPWVTREISSTSGPKATPLIPPLNTPPNAPCPWRWPALLAANCTLAERLPTRPPKT